MNDLIRDAAHALSGATILEMLRQRGLIVLPAIQGGWMWFLRIAETEPRFQGPDHPLPTAAAALAEGLDALLAHAAASPDLTMAAAIAENSEVTR